MNRHAFLIIAHNQFELLEMIVKLLDHPQNDIYIHIDKKVKDFDFAGFEKLTTRSKVFFTDRLNNTWGGYSGIKTELILLKAAIQGHYDYYHLISGVDLPIKSCDDIIEFFERNNGREFVHFCTDEFSFSEPTLSRVKYYHFLQERVGRRESGFLYMLERASLKIQRMLRVDRLKKLKSKPLCGCNWFSITDDLARYVVENEHRIKKEFGKSRCADEQFLQTLVAGSDFADRLYHRPGDGSYEGCARLIDWKRGDPYVFKIDDFDELMASRCIFARKFDLNVDRRICEKIFKTLKDG